MVKAADGPRGQIRRKAGLWNNRRMALDIRARRRVRRSNFAAQTYGRTELRRAPAARAAAGPAATKRFW